MIAAAPNVPSVNHMQNALPPYLRHYTTFAALRGIITSRSLWASDFRFVNDSREFRHAVDVAVARIEVMKSKLDDYEAAALDQLAYMFSAGETPSVYVASFTTEPDQLSQWRAYAQGTGVAIVFDTAKLRTASTTHDFELLQCVYERTEQEQAVDALLRRSLEHMRRVHPVRPENPKDMLRQGAYTKNIEEDFYRTAAMLKDPAFEEEHEWRLVRQREVPASQGHVKVRDAATLLVPFFDLSIDLGPSPHRPDFRDTPIVGVTVGPNQDPSLAEQAIRSSLLASKLLCYGSVTNSVVPLRRI